MRHQLLSVCATPSPTAAATCCARGGGAREVESGFSCEAGLPWAGSAPAAAVAGRGRGDAGLLGLYRPV